MPRFLSAENRSAFAERLKVYAEEEMLSRCVIVFHGGEPLLAGADSLAAFAQELRSALAPTTAVDVGLQTNGLLLTDAALQILRDADIAVSLSLDGPRSVNDLHRTTKKGRSSFDRTVEALNRLCSMPKVFAGVIAVIDPKAAPSELFEFFSQYKIPKIDFLLPDSHHLRLPPGRDVVPDLYKNWLIEAFDTWFDKYSELPVRTFEALLDAAIGLPSGTDAFGFGDVSLITIETDGTYHDLDVLKVVKDGATALSGSVADMAISEVVSSPAIADHRKFLTKSGLHDDCQSCDVVEICGGGSLPHRYGPNGFNQPTVYCREMQSLIRHIQGRLKKELAPTAPAVTSRLPPDFNLSAFELAETGNSMLALLWEDAISKNKEALKETLGEIAKSSPEAQSSINSILRKSDDHLSRLASQPGTVAWRRAMDASLKGRVVHTVDGEALNPSPVYLDFLASKDMDDHSGLYVSDADLWLRAPFGSSIVFEDEDIVKRARPLVAQALEIVRAWRPALADEMEKICASIQFVRDPAAHPEKIVSFSDNTVPGALFVSVIQGSELIDPYDLADSLIHEHRHQKLYLLERFGPTVQNPKDKVVSPWREDLRPPSGLLHAVFVFVELRRFWEYVRDSGPTRLRNRAINQIQETDQNLTTGLRTLRECQLSGVGYSLVSLLEKARKSPTLVER